MVRTHMSKYLVAGLMALGTTPHLYAQDAASDETFEDGVAAPSSEETAPAEQAGERPAAEEPTKVMSGEEAVSEEKTEPKTEDVTEEEKKAETEESKVEETETDATKIEPVHEATATESSSSSGTQHEFGKTVGKTKIHIGYAQPTFSKVKYYKDLYGSENGMPQFNVDRFFFASSFTVGLGFHLAYYKDSGKASLNKPSGDKAEKDPDSPTELTLLPLQIVATAQLSPFPQRWITLQAWGGMEYLYVQEVRHPKTESTPTQTTPTSGTPTTTSEPKTYVNSGSNYGAVTGVGLSFRLDSIDKGTVSTLPAIGLRSVYLTPYIEQVTTIRHELGKWDRLTMGLLFTFESLK